MDPITQPAEQSAADPYCGTPLGVEAAWCPDGIPVPPPEIGC